MKRCQIDSEENDDVDDFSMDIIFPLAKVTENHLAILIPNVLHVLSELAEYKIGVIFSLNNKVDIELIERNCKENLAVKVVCADGKNRLADNNKSNNIAFAVDISDAEAVFLLDDDVIIDRECVLQAWRYLKNTGIIKFMARYEDPDFFDKFDLFGIYFVNMVCADRQFWGNLGLKTRYIKEGRYRKDGLFDDLAIFRSCKWQGASFAYVTKPCVVMQGRSRNLGNFLEQRVRYSYENFAYLGRTVGYSAVAPLSVLLVNFSGLYGFLIFLAFLVGLFGLVAEVGRRRFHGQPIGFLPLYSFAYVLTNAITVWFAVIAKVRGGVHFGPSIVREPV